MLISPTGLLPPSVRLSMRIRLSTPLPSECPQPQEQALGLASFPFARRYLGNRCFFLFLRVLRCFSSPRSLLMSYAFTHGYLCITTGEFPHSEICGSMDICSSPQLFAACHVLHRLPVPRHPPYALLHLTLSSPLRALHKVFLAKESSGFSRFIVEYPIASLSTLLVFSRFSRFCVCFDTLVIQFSRYFFRPFRSMVENKGLEPLTPCVQGRCSPS